MKNIRVKILILTLALTIIFCAPCLAKVIHSNDGRFCFTTSDAWYLTSLGGDVYTDEIISVAYDSDTAVSVKRSKFKVGFREFRDCTYAQKSTFRDSFIGATTTFLRNRGYDVKINNTDILDNAIIVSYHLFRGGRKYHVFESYIVKGFVCYSVSLLSSEYTLKEATNVLFNGLTIDGINYPNWAS